MSIFNVSLLLLSIGLVYILFTLFRTWLFDRYFKVSLEESYNLDDLFPIKIQGKIIPKVDFLEIPYQDLSIEIKTKTIRGNIHNNNISLELIKLRDRKKSIYLVKRHYMKNVKSYIVETVRNKKEYIKLIRISNKEKQHIGRVACETCKHKMKCKISFQECNYERKTHDRLLSKGFRVDTKKNYELDNMKH